MALDSGIAKMGIFAFVFLVVFAAVIAMIPSEFSVSTKDYANPKENIPEEWNGINLAGYNFSDSWNDTLTWYPPGQDFYIDDLGGRYLRLLTYPADFLITDMYLKLFHRYGWLYLGQEVMYWSDSGGKSLGDSIYGSDLDDTYDSDKALTYTVLCKGESGAPLFGYSSYFYVTAMFAFNETLYSSPSNAWNNDALDILIGIDPQNEDSGGMDVWSLIGSLLTFNTLEVFGSSGADVITLNAILVAPIWACIIIFAAAVFLEVLPF